MKKVFTTILICGTILSHAQTHVFKRELQSSAFSLNMFKNPFDNSYYLYKSIQFIGINNQVDLVKMDTAGNVTNNIAVSISNILGFGPTVFPYSTGFIGGFQNQSVPNDYSIVSKIDNSGTVLWTKGYRHPDFLETIPVLVDEPNNMILSTGLLGDISAGGVNCLILKTGLNGTVMTTYKYNLVNASSVNGMFPNNLLKLNSGNYIYLASLYTPCLNCFSPVVLELDSAFQIISSQKMLLSLGDPTAIQFIKKPNDGFYAIGVFYQSGPNYISYSYVINFSPSLNKIWAKYTNNNTSNYSVIFTNGQITPDGGLIIGGTYTSPAGYNDMMLMKVDSMGNINWSNLIGQSSDDESISSFVYDPNDAIYIAGGGYDTAQSSSNVNGLFLKTDLTGNTSCGNNSFSA
ncbi:MAG: hypothetical protein ABIT08_05795, partial [Bacteroidia bacterium]